MEINVDPAGVLRWRDRQCRCALGRTGTTDGKQEGDLATPGGRFKLRSVFYRPDRQPRPDSGLPVTALSPEIGWCDDAKHPAYNLPVTLPHPASCEALWREDEIYDLIVVLGHNDRPVVAGAGSAIFIHLARPGYPPTAGCVALAEANLIALLKDCDPQTVIRIKAA